MSSRKDTNSIRLDNTSVSDSAFAVGTGASATNNSTVETTVVGEIATLRRLIAEQRADGALTDETAGDAGADLDDLEDELRRPKPNRSRIDRLLRRISSELGAVAALGSSVAAVITAVQSFGG